jgi:hypothetical protein
MTPEGLILFVQPFPVFCPRDCSRGVAAGFIFGGKENTGDGTPEGLPLIFRFSPGKITCTCSGASAAGVGSIFAMENPYPRHPANAGPCAFFPG